LTPGKDAYHVKGKLSVYDRTDRDTTSKVAPFEGAFRGLDPPSAPEQPSKPTKGSKETKNATGSQKLVSLLAPADAQLSITSGSSTSEIDLIVGQNGGIQWRPRTGPLANRVVHASEEIRAMQAEAAERVADVSGPNSVLTQARSLLASGKKDEAI